MTGSKAQFYFDILLSRIHKNVHERGQTHNLIVFGEPGAGKSYFALLLALELKKRYNFNFDVRKDIVFDVIDAAIRAKTSNRVIIFDEAAFAVDKMKSMTNENHLAAALIRMARKRQIVFIFVSQEYLALDFRIRFHIKNLVHVYEKDPQTRLWCLYKFTDFNRTKIEKDEILYNNYKVKFDYVPFPNPAELYPQETEIYEKIKDKNYKNEVDKLAIKTLMRRYNIEYEEAVELYKQLHQKYDDVEVEFDDNNMNFSKKYQDIVMKVLENLDEFVDVEKNEVDYKRIMREFEIPRASAWRIARYINSKIKQSAE